MTKIIAHCLVKNEERFIWYSLNSVLPYVDKILVWDTGSTDKTVEIINSIKSKKIDFRQIGSVNIHTFTDVRNQMLTVTPDNFNWLMILDGDEIWPSYSIKKATDYIRRNSNLESIVVPTNNLVGDIYHRSPDFFGHYQLVGKRGHLNLRFINLKKIPGLHVAKPHGQQGYYDKQGVLIQDRDRSLIKYLNLPYSHATHLQRSSTRTDDLKVPKRGLKQKFLLGQKISSKQQPKVFFEPHPSIVPKVTAPASIGYLIKAVPYTLASVLKQLLTNTPSGY